MSLALLLAGLLVMALMVRSPFGLILKGIRENPARMKALGYPVYWVRVTVFVIAALYAGIGGIIAVYATGIVTPTTIQLSRTIWVLLVVILGGANYFWGPVVWHGHRSLAGRHHQPGDPTLQHGDWNHLRRGRAAYAQRHHGPAGQDRAGRGRARRAAVERREGGDAKHVNRVS